MTDSPKLQFSARKGLTVQSIGDTLVFEDAETGFKATGNTSPSDPNTRHQVTWPTTWTPVLKETRASKFWDRFIPTAYPTWLTQDSSLWNDQKPYTNGTGGGRRNFVSPCLLGVRDGDASWIAIEESWNRDQENRPLAHDPMIPGGDQFSRKKTSLGLPKEWQHDKQLPNGWNGFDTAHMDYGRMLSLAVRHDPMGLVNMWLVWYFMCGSTMRKYGDFGATTNFLTQDRGWAWTVLWDLIAVMLDFGQSSATAAARDLHCDGHSPLHNLKTHVSQMWTGDYAQYGREWTRKPKGKEFPVIDSVDWRGWGPQAVGEQVFQDGILMWAAVVLLKSPYVVGTTRTLLKALYTDRKNFVLDRAYTAGGGFAWSVGWTLFTPQSEADLLRDAVIAADPQGAYETHQDPTSLKWIIRGTGSSSTPVKWGSDKEAMFAAAVAAQEGPSDAFVVDFINNSGQYGSSPQYDLIIAAAVEKGGPL